MSQQHRVKSVKKDHNMLFCKGFSYSKGGILLSHRGILLSHRGIMVSHRGIMVSQRNLVTLAITALQSSVFLQYLLVLISTN